jgi:Kdo2-lipid IVA lauroyltransferase/acyltransferase
MDAASGGPARAAPAPAGRRAAHVLEAAALDAVWGAARALPWRSARGLGAGLGGVAHGLGIRRRVAMGNLARAFPERPEAERAAILAAHWRELGRVAVEYAQLPALVRAAAGEVVAAVHGVEHFEAARAAGRGAILMTGHFGAFELLGAWLTRLNPVDFVVKPLSNPNVEARVRALRRAAGVGTIGIGDVRQVFERLRANGWVAMLADQDARRRGVFVPFLGTPASTHAGPARIALRTGAPIIMGFPVRRADGRFDLHVEPPLAIDPGEPDPVRALTAAHTARLEHWVRRVPDHWFWLHRRWKTPPPD